MIFVGVVLVLLGAFLSVCLGGVARLNMGLDEIHVERRYKRSNNRSPTHA